MYTEAVKLTFFTVLHVHENTSISSGMGMDGNTLPTNHRESYVKNKQYMTPDASGKHNILSLCFVDTEAVKLTFFTVLHVPENTSISSGMGMDGNTLPTNHRESYVKHKQYMTPDASGKHNFLYAL